MNNAVRNQVGKAIQVARDGPIVPWELIGDEMKEVTKVTWGCKCVDFCVPGKSCKVEPPCGGPECRRLTGTFLRARAQNFAVSENTARPGSPRCWFAGKYSMLRMFCQFTVAFIAWPSHFQS